MAKISDNDVILASNRARCGAEAARFLGVNYKTYKSMAYKNGCFKKDQGVSMRGKKSKLFFKGMEDFLNGRCENKKISGNRIINYLIYSGLREYKCEKCGISKWMGDDIVLHSHHKDGNHLHNVINNIAILCPNCHSQTDTFGRKNVKSYAKKRDCVVSIKREKLPDKVSIRCQECGIVRMVSRCIAKKTSLCRKCSAKKRELPTKPDCETLKIDISNSSYLELARKYRTSNTTIKRWCKSYGIVLKKRGTREIH